MAAEVVTHAVEQPCACAQHCRIGMEKDFYVTCPRRINPQLSLICNSGAKTQTTKKTQPLQTPNHFEVISSSGDNRKYIGISQPILKRPGGH